MKHFYLSHVCTVSALILAYLWGGWQALTIAVLLTIMEVSLSFDNAVVNATVLKHMSRKWQQRFLTWGILIAVFGMRLVFPVLIVAFATGLDMVSVTQLAFQEPVAYSQHVLDAHVQIAAFGGMFLLMVFLHFILDTSKEVHWIRMLEYRLVRLGRFHAMDIIVALFVLLATQYFLPEEDQHKALFSGLIGMLTFICMKSLANYVSRGKDGDVALRGMSYSGLMGFLYLELLDISFSLDGVIGAFAMSNDVVVIMLGLGVGAMFVRSLTVYLVRKGTLDEYVYLEHGAHYGIGALAAIMLFSMVYHVPEIITGLIGVTFIGLSLLSSVRYRRMHKGDTHGD